ncbi:MAG: hypothetical protein KGS72_24010 [Cyanobacteria bacterium REEB67]|nr:hypothetical protein [Cyanobacteria bacterium REEB67]
MFFALSFLTVLAAASGGTVTGQCCLASDGTTNNPAAVSVGSRLKLVCPLVPRRAIKSVPKNFELYQFDSSPLDGRAPLLLIHGLLGERHAQFRWQQLAKYLSQDEAIERRYKIYLVRYDTQLSLHDLTATFQAALRDVPEANRLTILTISLSGEIVRDAMKDPAVDRSIARVITMGAFYRGSPLFCHDWMKETIRKRHISPLTRFYRSVGYKLYFDRHKSLQRDYRWDDSDSQMPAASLSQDHEEPAQLPAHIETKLEESRRQASDRKFVVYTGYLHNRYTPRPRSTLHTFLLSPVSFFGTTLPAHLGREHPMLRFINNFIAESVPAKDSQCRSIYPLNDGISPVTSGLLLSNEFMNNLNPCSPTSIDDLRIHSNARKARLFDNTDHLTFIESRRPRGSQDVIDVFSQDEKARPMFAWILKDLTE